MAQEKARKRGFFKSFVDVRRWVFYDEIINNAKIIVNLGKSVLLLDKKPTTTETFAEAVERFQLSENDLVLKEKHFFQFTLSYLIIGFLLLCYATYLLLFVDALMVGSAVIIMALLMFVYAYREHFWFMQIRKRKLGCSFKEWVRFVTKREQV
ncbi:MAG: type IVB secretion system protein IcmV [Gammaproteobacteria bacterium]|nr:type IVB secretion system protein IcmV [Gammaproteobacteria bacterium]